MNRIQFTHREPIGSSLGKSGKDHYSEFSHVKATDAETA
jgi:hypothetical protein